MGRTTTPGDDIPPEIDFSTGARGKFFESDAAPSSELRDLTTAQGLKVLFASAPLESVDLTRSTDTGRDADL